MNGYYLYGIYGKKCVKSRGSFLVHLAKQSPLTENVMQSLKNRASFYLIVDTALDISICKTRLRLLQLVSTWKIYADNDVTVAMRIALLLNTNFKSLSVFDSVISYFRSSKALRSSSLPVVFWPQSPVAPDSAVAPTVTSWKARSSNFTWRRSRPRRESKLNDPPPSCLQTRLFCEIHLVFWELENNKICSKNKCLFFCPN